MKKTDALRSVIAEQISREKLLAAGTLVLIGGAVFSALLPPLALEKIVNLLTAGSGVSLPLAFGYFGLLALSALFEAAQNTAITVFGQKITHGLRAKMCAKLRLLPAAYYTGHEAGKITSRFVNDVDAVDALFTNGIISMFADACKLVSIIAVVFFKSAGLGLLLLGATPLLFWMTRGFQRLMLRAQLRNREAVAKVNNHIPETIRNIRMIRAFFRQDYMEQKYDRSIQESYRAQEKSNLCDSVYSPIVIFISALIVAITMVLSAMGGGFRTFFSMSAGTAAAIIAYVGKVFDPLESIGMEIQNIQSAVAGVRRIREFLEEPERVCGTVSPEKSCREPRVCFDGVSFAYQEDAPVLRDLSFEVKPGETVTLVGRTGAGKSTALRLLLGLYSPSRGHITVGGVDAASVQDEGKRALFGYVEQTFHPVEGTVAQQISLFDPTVDAVNIQRAAQLVGLHEAISQLEKGYDTPIGDVHFSQGQFQLLSIARAVAAEPAVLLLDEITANLDSDTERRVLEALERASKNRTVLSVSHRLYEATAAGRLISVGE